MMRKYFLWILLSSVILFLVGVGLVLAPWVAWWEDVLGGLSILLALGGFGMLGMLQHEHRDKEESHGFFLKKKEK